MAESEKKITEQELKNFVIKLRKKHSEIEQQQFFCSKHNFNLEAVLKNSEANIVKRIIHDMEMEFELGFVWDKSLD